MRRRENHGLRRRLSASTRSARVFAVHREELDLDRFVAALLAMAGEPDKSERSRRGEHPPTEQDGRRRA